MLTLEPERATALGLDKGAHAALRGRSSDRSATGRARAVALLKADLAATQRLPRLPLSAASQTHLAVVQSAYRTALDGFALPYGDVAIGSWRNSPYAVIQNVGAWIDVPRLLEADQPVGSRADAEAWLARLADMAPQLDGETQRIAAARGIGLVPPAFLLDKTIAQMGQSLAAFAGDGGSLLHSFAGKTATLPGPWRARAQGLLRERVVPALERQLAELRRQRAVATAAAGMRGRPHGEAWYAWGLRAGTTTTRTPEDIHRIGRAQLAELQARMEEILRGLGLTSGSIAARIDALQKDARNAFPTGDEGRRQIVAYMQDRVDWARAQMPRAFRRLVGGKLEIRRLPEAEEIGAPPAYGGAGAIDGSIPSRIWVNLRDTAMHNRVTIPDLVFHEGIPGHVWQGEYTQTMPLIRSLLAFNAYSEGWALYGEQLADELGAYDADPAGRLGYLQGFAWRAVRLIIDTGIHAMGWSREQALAEFTAATGLPESTAVSEVERYCAWPGQACGYKMGQNEMVAQRERARAALGARFDLRDFNQAVIDGGNVPLDVLATNVAGYVAAARG
ncbi:DUF885 domain-containing protein [Novosphingobium piscinae]|uniref:DUF885 domain-containing protein n=1 Tax=Novosphingobium piscinae TaxID=1507448 RepID=A0A7X1FXA7_9SPHN|nr:DUF885 domain-containing protein [Novosphingobium piscinae]